ncbi:MAG: hypothetical protein Q8Q51_11245 [Lutibacter sp.]|nr:hypothetical protein [Lutibacter sp.]
MDIKREILNKYVEVNNERLDAHKEYVKNLITVGIGFLALFVGLKTDNIMSMFAKYFYLSTVILLVLGILSSSISLYFEIYIHNQNQKFLKKCMSDHLEGKFLSDRLNITTKPWYYKVFEKLGFICFFCSPISLIIYIYFLEF